MNRYLRLSMVSLGLAYAASCVPEVSLRSDEKQPSTATGGDTSSGRDASTDDAWPTADALSPPADASPDGVACDGNSCAPSICKAATYGGDSDRTSATSTVISDIGAHGFQNLLSGASSDGAVIMEQRWCGGDGSTWLYDGDLAPRKYTGVDITSELSDVGIGEGNRYLAPDGLTVLATRLDGIGFVEKRRASRSTTSFSAADASMFAEVNDWASRSATQAIFPAMSFDGHSLYFIAVLPSDPTTWVHFEASRERVDLPFSAPSGPSKIDSQYGQVSAAPDPSTVFVGRADYSTEVLVRARPDAPFRDMENVWGMRAVPVGAECGAILANGSPGGCPLEEVFVLSAFAGDASSADR